MLEFNLSRFNAGLLLFTSSLFGLYFYLTRNLNFWKKRGIDGPKPILFFGTFYQAFFKSTQEVTLENTKKYGKIHGVFLGHRPILMLAEPQLAKDILIKDFHIFVDRSDFQSGNVLNDRSLLNLNGDEWKRMRSIISPTFSSSKMRKMHPIIVDCVQRLEVELKKIVIDQEIKEIELKKMMSHLTMDVIASCAFGTRIDVYNETQKNEFVKSAEKIFHPTPRLILFFLMNASFPRLAKWLRLTPHPPSAEKFFRSTIKAIMERRRSENRTYHDYLQLMLDAMNKTNNLEEQDFETEEREQIFGHTNETIKTNTRGEITEDDLLATSFLFFFAGYETTASLLSYFFYELALNEKCQQKLYEEVNKFEDKLDYESFAQMPYLEACVAETLRIFNPIPHTGRLASEEYTIGDTGIKIPKGVLVNIDIQTLHHSPEYYPDPERWDPQRFMPENRDKLVPYTYMPFGMGPRNCVGMRFALMEAKTAIAYLVNKFEFIRTPNTKLLTKPKKLQLIVNYGDLNVGIKLRN